MHRVDVYRMICRRAREAGLDADICCQTFRATGITAYLENGGTLENAQAMAAHESPRTTKLYDPTADEITLDRRDEMDLLTPNRIDELFIKLKRYPVKDMNSVGVETSHEDICLAACRT